MHSHERLPVVRGLDQAIVISSWLVIWPEASTRFVIGICSLDDVDLLARRVLTTPVGPLTCLGSATSLRVSVRQSLNRRQSRRVVVAAVKSRLREYVANRDSLLNKWNPQAWWRPPDSTKPLYSTVTLFDLVISSDPSGNLPDNCCHSAHLRQAHCALSHSV